MGVFVGRRLGGARGAGFSRAARAGAGRGRGARGVGAPGAAPARASACARRAAWPVSREYYSTLLGRSHPLVWGRAASMPKA